MIDYVQINRLLDSLAKTKFRGSFHLNKKMRDYVTDKGMDVIRKHAYDFVNNRIKIRPVNDGKQTPMKGHPVFIAQHATGTCCRGCLERIHKISKNKELSSDEIDYIVLVLMMWIKKEMEEVNL